MTGMTFRPMPGEAFGSASYIVDAHPEAPKHRPLQVELTECYQCGALVHDTDTHATWHAWLFDRLGVPREGA
jgi:hypothetical protein